MSIPKEAIEAVAEELFAIFVGHMWANQHEGQKSSYRKRAERLLTFTAALPHLAQPSKSEAEATKSILDLAQMYKTLGSASQHEDAALIAHAIREHVTTLVTAVRAEASAAKDAEIAALREALLEARNEISIERMRYAITTISWERSGLLLDRLDAALEMSGGVMPPHRENCTCYQCHGA